MSRKHRRREATPVAHMILSKRMADHRPHDMICELADNAFDADARRVWIELRPKAEIVTLRGGELRRLRVDWEECLRNEHFPCMDEGRHLAGPRDLRAARGAGYAYRFVEDTTELFKGVSTAHLQVFLGEEWKECLGTHENRLDVGREALFEDIRSRAKD